jgi:hypothetical protein
MAGSRPAPGGADADALNELPSYCLRIVIFAWQDRNYTWPGVKSMSSFDFARTVDAEPATELLERRWFAAFAAVKSLQAECDVLLGVLELSGDAWRRACAQLAQLEALRDALGNQLAAMDEPRAVSRDMAIPYEEMSAA